MVRLVGGGDGNGGRGRTYNLDRSPSSQGLLEALGAPSRSQKMMEFTPCSTCRPI
jgi:hypothetical protein